MLYEDENGKIYEIDDDRIDKAMDALDISLAEACEMILADDGLIKNEVQEKLEECAKNAPRRYEQSAKTRKKAEKERKIDENKAELLEIIHDTLQMTPNLAITGQKNEVELYFWYKNDDYTLKLTKHRPKK